MPIHDLLEDTGISRLQRIVVREEFIRIVSSLERIEPRQLAGRIPAQRPLVAVTIIDIDFDVGGAGAAGRNEETAGGVADF